MAKKGYGSVFGEPIRQIDYLLRMIDKNSMKVLIPDDFDGRHTIYVAKKGHFVDCYENDKVLINGGNIDSFQTVGIKERIKEYALNDKVKLVEGSLFSKKIIKDYDFVFCYKSLNLDRNNCFKRDLMIRKLKSSVKENGYLYIKYILADKDTDYINFPKYKYFRRKEIMKYFDDSWEVIYCKENNFKSIDYSHPFHKEDHHHTMGSIFLKKKYKKRKYKYYYNIYTPNDYSLFNAK